jgi:uncharacterized SAM-binding protein YcdF (DUF218 family)
MSTNLILHLGGNIDRLEKTAELAHRYPNAKVIVSSELPRNEVIQRLQLLGVELDRCCLDYKAWDTVTNFIKTLPIIRSVKAKKVFVVTDLFHMRRSMAIAKGVYFLRGIEPVACPYMGYGLSHKEPDKLVREDTLRAWLWRLTGWLVYSKKVYDARMPAYLAAEAEQK